jgi:transcriptional regulator GlxA family with amidase domain
VAEIVGILSLLPNAASAHDQLMTSRSVAIVAFPGVQSLDVTGPLEVFASASRLLAHTRDIDDAYQVEVLGPEPGSLSTSSGLELVARGALGRRRRRIDTLVIAGGEGVRAAAERRRFVAAIRRQAERARRVASVCTGAFLLAEAGLLDGRRVTTHWRWCQALQERYPSLEVDPDPIYIRDEHIYTSAGVTAGMDLALALVEDDWGREVALSVARLLVLFLKRPGGQSQFSATLAVQHAHRDPLRRLQTWIVDNIDADLSVRELARRAGMSERNFARAFSREVGQTPARYVESARIEAARRHLEESSASVEEIAWACGFGSAETMRRAFVRRLRVSPADYRKRFEITIH